MPQGSYSQGESLPDERLIIDQSGSQVIELGFPLKLTVVLNPKFYREGSLQWQFKELGEETFADITGENDSVLYINSFDFSLQGDYRLLISFDGNTHQSLPLNVRVKGQTNTCVASDLSMHWPLDGPKNSNWHLNNFFDLQRLKENTEDFTGAKNKEAYTYDQHKGIDISLFNFASMDQGVVVREVQGGIVEIVHDGEPDRNLTREDWPSNRVVVRHPNGFTTAYLHLKKDSILVKVGDEIEAGDPLGLVGSSGNSDGPHLHLETQNCSGISIDHIVHDLFSTLPVLDKDPQFLFNFLRTDRPFSSQDPPRASEGQSITKSKLGQTVYIASKFSNVKMRDVVKLKFLPPSDSDEGFEMEQIVSDTKTNYSAYSTWRSFHLNRVGEWQIEFYLNEKKYHSMPFTVIPNDSQ